MVASIGFDSFLVLGLYSSFALAYLDPGTGSLVLQMLLAGALTAAASIRIFWARIKDTARRMLGTEAKAPPSTKP